MKSSYIHSLAFYNCHFLVEVYAGGFRINLPLCTGNVVNLVDTLCSYKNMSLCDGDRCVSGIVAWSHYDMSLCEKVYFKIHRVVFFFFFLCFFVLVCLILLFFCFFLFFILSVFLLLL